MAFKITILGSSGALPAYGRFPTSQFIEIQNRFILIDAGEGTQMQLMRYQIPFHKISYVFISHLHGDHYLGLTGLIFTMHLQRRVTDLHIFSQRGLDEIILAQLKHSKSVLNYQLFFHTIEPETKSIILDEEVFTVETIPLYHKISCSGFLFKEKIKSLRINKEKLQEGMLLQHIALLKTGTDVKDDNGEILYRSADFTIPPRPSYSYAFCSDTGYYEPIIESVKGVDLLYHEATFMQEEIEKASDTRHSTTLQAATIAKKSGVKALLIGHFSARYRDLAPVLEEARTIFPATSLAIEGETFELEG